MTADPVQHEEPSHCHNCGAAVTYHYCALCGQETTLHVPSAGEFIHEFVGHYVALEGRLWKTLACLLFKPGFLSAEYLAGRRARYVQPLRVYLSLSVLFFALVKVVGLPVADYGDETTGKPASSMKIMEADNADLNISFAPELTAKFKAFMKKPEPERDRLLTGALFSYVPYAMFCLMPLFALYLKLLYFGSGRRYGEHLLFALHTNAFAFAMFGILILASNLGWGLLTFALWLWLFAYLPKAMRRVYGGSLLATGLRWVVLSVLHVLSILVAILATVGLAIMH
ncbi:MAG: DUF3667 domain-containing protein [Pseudomonadota bacterium]